MDEEVSDENYRLPAHQTTAGGPQHFIILLPRRDASAALRTAPGIQPRAASCHRSELQLAGPHGGTSSVQLTGFGYEATSPGRITVLCP
jgi:hypothetical protein